MAMPLALPELAEHPPAGPNLELAPAFGEMERAAQGKAETQFGSTVEPATPPDWKAAAALAAGLLDRTGLPALERFLGRPVDAGRVDEALHRSHPTLEVPPSAVALHAELVDRAAAGARR